MQDFYFAKTLLSVIIHQGLQSASVLKAWYATADHIKLINVFQKGSESKLCFLSSIQAKLLPLSLTPE